MSAVNIEISSVGAKVKYAFESTAGTRPTTGYTELPGIIDAPDVALSYDTAEVSTIDEGVKRYVVGQADPGSDKAFTSNHNEATIEAWETLCTSAETNIASGKRLWFEYSFPGATKSFYWAGMPKTMGNPGIQKGTIVGQLSLPVILTKFEGWDTKST